MKKTIAILALAALGLTTASAGVHIGINFGIPLPVVTAPAPVVVAPAPVVLPPPMPAPILEVAPTCPTPGYAWVVGSWGWCDNHWVWTRGHWGPPVHYGYRPGHYADFHGGFHGEHGHR